MCDGLMNSFILIPLTQTHTHHNPETTVSASISQSTTSCSVDVYACVSQVGLCFISLSVVDLLAALNMSRHMNGVSRLQSHSSTTYRIRPRAPYLTLPREYSHFLHSKLHAGMGVHLVGQQASGSSATLFSLSSASSPILQIISSTLNNTLHVDYQAAGGAQGQVSFHYPSKNPFAKEEWVQLAVSLETDRLIFFVDCQEAVVTPIKSKERINLELPQDVVVTLASTPGKRDSKFSVSFLHILHTVHTYILEDKRHHFYWYLLFTVFVCFCLRNLLKTSLPSVFFTW